MLSIRATTLVRNLSRIPCETALNRRIMAVNRIRVNGMRSKMCHNSITIYRTCKTKTWRLSPNKRITLAEARGILRKEEIRTRVINLTACSSVNLDKLMVLPSQMKPICLKLVTLLILSKLIALFLRCLWLLVPGNTRTKTSTRQTCAWYKTIIICRIETQLFQTIDTFCKAQQIKNSSKSKIITSIRSSNLKKCSKALKISRPTQIKRIAKIISTVWRWLSHLDRAVEVEPRTCNSI